MQVLKPSPALFTTICLGRYVVPAIQQAVISTYAYMDFAYCCTVLTHKITRYRCFLSPHFFFTLCRKQVGISLFNIYIRSFATTGSPGSHALLELFSNRLDLC